MACSDARPAPPGGLVVRDDALNVGRHVAPGAADVVYLDPPFAVGVRFGARDGSGHRAKGPVAYDDVWPSFDAYLDWLDARLAAAATVLAPHGTLWLQLDARAVHDAKVRCDARFGRAAFAGEVVWVPGNGSKSRSGPGHGHQTILRYTPGGAGLWHGDDPALRAPYAATSRSMHFTQMDEAGRRYRERRVGEKVYRYYEDRGRAIGSVWTDCPAMEANSPLRPETTGYPTQKPLKLLDRLVRASSRPGGLVVDPFMGSGTTLVAAHRAGRAFVGLDVGERAVAVTRARLAQEGAPFA